jgi:hypothetical protein
VTLLQWNINFLSGPNHCKAQVHVYAGFSSGYVVEGNRVSGDSCVFRSMYSQLKTELALEEDNGVCYDSFTVFTPIPNPPALLATSSDLHGLGPIFRMAQSQFAESQLEAARTLCELSNDESMRLQMVTLGCVQVLMELLSVGHSEWVQQHALLALANLSDCCECRYAFFEIGAALMPVILGLCCDGSYHTAEVRKLGAYILANVSSHAATSVASLIGTQSLATWMPTVDMICDERVRLHSSRARDNLSVCV